jgi:NAD dependent epimerase/dehydratase family enzyme
LTGHRPRCFRMAWMTSRSSMKLMIRASAVGYYGFHRHEVLTEAAPAGKDFLARLAAAWEEEAGKAGGKGARVVITRFGSC